MKHNSLKPQAIPRRRRTVARAIVFSTLVLVVLAAAGYLLVSGLFPKLPAAAANTIDITASMSGFSSDVVRVRAGDEVTVHLTSVDNSYHSDGGGKHQWAVDELGLISLRLPLEASL